jgi:hypothetical protein
LIGSTLLDALVEFGAPKEEGAIAVAGVTKPCVVLAAAVILAAADSDSPVKAIESVLTFASSALACVEGQSIESVVGAAVRGWHVARNEGEPTGAARAFLDWAMVADEPAAELGSESVESSDAKDPVFSLFGGEADYLAAAGGLVHACHEVAAVEPFADPLQLVQCSRPSEVVEVEVEVQVGGSTVGVADDPLAGTWGAPMECMSQSELEQAAAEAAPPPKVAEVLPKSLYVSGPLGSAVSRFR